MPSPRLLVIEGNTAELRARQVSAGGQVMSDGYADLLRNLLPEAVVDICYPADPGANLPIGGLEGYDGVAITGSALNVYDGGPNDRAADRTHARGAQEQNAAVRKLLGLAGHHGGGGRHGARQPEGQGDRRWAAHRAHAGRARHPMYAGKDAVFDAVTVHLDEVETLAPGTTVLAANAQSGVQAAEINVDGAVAWAVQYHPEFSLADMAAIVRRYGQRLIGEGFFADEAARDGYVADLEALDRAPDNKPLAWRYGIDAAVLDPRVRTAEIANWITHQVLPARAKRGRA